MIAAAIGLLALAVSAYTAYVQRQQLRAQVWPHLEIGSGNVAPVIGFRVTNSGTGPALVTAVRVAVDKKPVATWWDAQQQVGSKSGGVIYSALGGRVLPPGKEMMMITPFGETTPQFEELFKHAIVVTACYCSVLDECWVVTSEAAGVVVDPEPCPIPAAERFKD